MKMDAALTPGLASFALGRKKGRYFSVLIRRYSLGIALESAFGRRTPERPLVYRHTIDATTYAFPDLRDLLAKATPPRSGDRLAGIAAASAEENVAAKIALADVPLKQILADPVVPYE